MIPEQHAESVRLRCQVCGWASDAIPVVADRPNALWHAKQSLLPNYHEHFAAAHRPPPYHELIDGQVEP